VKEAAKNGIINEVGDYIN